MKRRRKRLLVLAGVICSIALVGCQKEEGKTKVRMGYFPNITHTQALVMKDQETLEQKWKDNCEVSWTGFNAGPAEVEAIFAGEIDIGYIGPVPAINAFVKSKGDVVIISNATNAGAVLLKSEGSDIQTVADLSGKKVAVPQMGNTQHLSLLDLLSQNDLAPVSEGGDVEVVAVANSDVANMMDQGNIDAALVPEPWGSILENQSGAQIVLDYDEIFLEGNYPTAVVVVRKEFMEEHPELVDEFLKEHENTTTYINENSHDMFEIVNRQIEAETSKTYDLKVLESAFKRIKVSTDLEENAIKAFGDICYEQGFIQDEMQDGIIGKE